MKSPEYDSETETATKKLIHVAKRTRQVNTKSMAVNIPWCQTHSKLKGTLMKGASNPLHLRKDSNLSKLGFQARFGQASLPFIKRGL